MASDGWCPGFPEKTSTDSWVSGAASSRQRRPLGLFNGFSRWAPTGLRSAPGAVISCISPRSGMTQRRKLRPRGLHPGSGCLFQTTHSPPLPGKRCADHELMPRRSSLATVWAVGSTRARSRPLRLQPAACTAAELCGLGDKTGGRARRGAQRTAPPFEARLATVRRGTQR